MNPASIVDLRKLHRRPSPSRKLGPRPTRSWSPVGPSWGSATAPLTSPRGWGTEPGATGTQPWATPTTSPNESRQPRRATSILGMTTMTSPPPERDPSAGGCDERLRRAPRKTFIGRQVTEQRCLRRVWL